MNEVIKTSFDWFVEFCEMFLSENKFELEDDDDLEEEAWREIEAS